MGWYHQLVLACLVQISLASIDLPSHWKFCSADGTVAENSGSIEDGERKWPFIVRLSLGRWGYLCSGTLIDGTTVITAAHCCDGYEAQDIKVNINDHFDDKINANIRVQSVEVHTNFRKHTYVNDICVLKLKMEVTALLSEIERSSHDNHYPCVPSSDAKFGGGTICYALGWGLEVASNGKKHSTKIQTQSVNVIGNGKCEELMPLANPRFPQYHSPREMICGSTKQVAVENSCQGDSGGPLICEVEGRAVMAGITSFGPQCSTINHPAEFTRVSNYIKFIGKFQNNGKYQNFNMSRTHDGKFTGKQKMPTFARIAERRADKSRIRRYCKRSTITNQFSEINLALQQKKVDSHLEGLTECYLQIRERRLGKLPPFTPESVRDREILKLDTFGKKQVCRRAQYKGHRDGLPCWKECEKVMVDTQHKSRHSTFSDPEKNIIAYWIKECSKRVIRKNKMAPRGARIMARNAGFG